MFDVFIGQHENKIDGKFRLSIPAHFRKVIERGHKDRDPGALANFVLVFGDERTDYLEGITVARYNRITKKIRRMAKSDPRRKQLELTVFVNAQPMILDETGRIVMPPQGRQKLGLDANDMVAFAGAGDSFLVRRADVAASADVERPPADPAIGYHPETNPMDYLDGDEDDDDDEV